MFLLPLFCSLIRADCCRAGSLTSSAGLLPVILFMVFMILFRIARGNGFS